MSAPTLTFQEPHPDRDGRQCSFNVPMIRPVIAFGPPAIFGELEAADVEYVVAMAKSAVLEAAAAPLLVEARGMAETTGARLRRDVVSGGDLAPSATCRHWIDDRHPPEAAQP